MSTFEHSRGFGEINSEFERSKAGCLDVLQETVLYKMTTSPNQEVLKFARTINLWGSVEAKAVPAHVNA